MSFRPRLRSRMLVLLVLAGLFAFVGTAVPSAGKSYPAFRYTFRVLAVTATGTYTSGDATTKTNIRIAKPSGPVKMVWRGPGPIGTNSGGVTWHIPFTGDAVYTSSDARCNRTIKMTSAGSNPLVLLFYGQYSNREIYASIRKFPLATGYPTKTDGTCGLFRKDWWQDASKSYPFSLLKKKQFSVTVHHQETFDDGSGAIEWTITWTIKKLSFGWMKS
jgi:3',5'-cyclic AMP phosphodiesterase CpdA